MEHLYTVKIGPVDVPVYEDGELEDYGLYEELPKQRIRISSRNGLAREMTLLHEILHAMSEQYGVALSEHRVRALEQIVTQFVIDNPEFVRDWVSRVSRQD